MNSINVVLAWRLREDLIQELRGISPRLRITDASALLDEERRLGRESRRSVEHRRASRAADAALSEAQVLLSGYRPTSQMPDKMPRLKWVKQVGAGVDYTLRKGPIGRGITLTNARGSRRGQWLSESSV